MRIGFEAKRLFLNDRGLGNYARNLLYGLLKYQGNNDYHLYTTKFSNKYINSDVINAESVSIHTASGLLSTISKSAWRSFLLGKATKIDGMDIFHGLAQELPTDIARSNAKSVVTIHDMIFLKHPEFYKPIDRWIYNRKVKFAVESCDKVIAISEQTKQDIVSHYGVDEEKISVVYQSCNEVFYEKRAAQELAAVKNKWALPKQYILYVGALNENKNVITILLALRQMKGKMDLPLVVVGKGDAYKSKMLQYATKNELLNQLVFASDIAEPTPTELSCFYQLASVFVFPSYYEGFGIPILEARFSGIPVIASNSSCLAEAGGESSNYFNPKDPEQLANQLLNILSIAPSKQAVDFNLSVEGSTVQLMNIYKNL